jgi:peptidoglycan/LPS O-acetylase OafA/YrhL
MGSPSSTATSSVAVAVSGAVAPAVASGTLDAAAVEFQAHKDHVPVLDGLRGIAVLLVLWSHSLVVTDRVRVLRILGYVLQPGYFGVDIFFVLSGFLITRILLSNKIRNRPVGNFLIRRFLRIFPIYYLTLLVVEAFRPGRYVAWCAVYLSNFYFAFTHISVFRPLGHTWSLAVEEHFYLIWPLLVYALSIRRSRAVALWGFIPVAILSAIVILALRSHLPATKLIYMGTMCRASSLATGALFAFHENWLRENGQRAWTAAVVLILPAMIILPLGEFILQPLIPLLKMVGFSLLCGGVLAGVIGLRDSQLWPARLLRGAILTFVGRISYGLYLYHAPIFFALGIVKKGRPSVMITALAWVLVFTVATASFYAVERPILRLKDRFQ